MKNQAAQPRPGDCAQHDSTSGGVVLLLVCSCRLFTWTEVFVSLSLLLTRRKPNVPVEPACRPARLTVTVSLPGAWLLPPRQPPGLRCY